MILKIYKTKNQIQILTSINISLSSINISLLNNLDQFRSKKELFHKTKV